MRLPEAFRPKALQLPALMAVGAAAGIVAIGSLIAIAASLPFYRLLKASRDDQFLLEIEAMSRDIEQYLNRITDVTIQVTSRTKAREALEAYDDGRLSLEELREFSLPILEDALNLGASVVGITRFDRSGEPVLRVGSSPAVEPAILDSARADGPQLLGPYTSADRQVLIVVAGIKNRRDDVVGIDAVAFDLADPLAALRRYAAANDGQQLFLGLATGDRSDVFFESSGNRRPGGDSVDSRGLMRSALAEGRTGEVRWLPSAGRDTTSGAAAYYRFEQPSWLLAVHSDRSALYEPIYRILAEYVLTLMTLIVIGGLATYRLLHPLANKIVTLTTDLQTEVAERVTVERSLARRARQQEAVANLGQLCLTSAPLETLLDEAVRVTAATLEVEYCKVLELDAGGQSLSLRAGVGWQEGVVGNARVSIDDTSQAGHTLRAASPIIVEDLATETRFSGPQLLIDHGVRSGVSVIVDPDNPWGVLGAHSTHKRSFSHDDVNFVQSVANCLAEAIERRQAELARKASEERFRGLYDENPATFITVGASLCIESINQYGAEQLGYEAKDLIGRPIQSLSHPDDAQLLMEYLGDCLASGRSISRWELRKQRRDGATIWVRETARGATNGNGERNVLIVCEDVSEARALSEKLSYEAAHDPLTGLVNRREFEHRLHRTIGAAREEGGEHVLCYMDLDQFKVINDNCGHMAGDQLLCQIANLLRETLRKGDTIARLGGDEFGLLLEHCSIDRAVTIANELRSKVEEFRFSWDHNTFYVGMSMGLAAVTASSGSMTDLLRNADTACYVAKDAGRNRVHVYRENDAELNKRHGEMQWVARINNALDQGRFRLYAQTIEAIQPAANREIHHELLLRLLDTDGSVILPGAFLPAAERYGLAVKIDRWVVKTLFERLQSYPGLSAELGICSINVSGQSLADPEFLAYVSTILADNKVAARRLCFEITETAAISSLPNALRFIGSIKKFGCRFSLDDFGSGLSSFAYLKTLPVDYLKIDGVFVKDIINDAADFAMVKSIHDIGKAMGKTTIAEFVEREEIKIALAHIGVDYVQGYSVGPPRPLEEFNAIARKSARGDGKSRQRSA